MKNAYLKNIREIIDNVKGKIPNFNSNRLIQAYRFALKAHKGQKRKGGDDYIIHPLQSAKILSGLRADENTLIASILHDVPEDTFCTIDDIQKKFGEHVAFLVNGVTKLSKVYYKHDMMKRDVESLKKLLLHTSKDPRVIFIKLADRLHNMRTIKFVKKEKQARIARETLEVYVPIANLMGIQGIKNELEDLCFQNLYSQEYKLFSSKIQKFEENLREITDDIIKTISKELTKHKIKADVFYRKKSIFTIFKKIKSLGKTVDDVFDLITLRAITDDIESCYKIIGVVHSLFKPDPGRFKDYIAIPKINGYQSLHTTVFGKDGIPIEIQIRTQEMNENSEMGLNLVKLKTIPSKMLNWMEQILEIQKDEPDIDYFMKDLKYEIFSDRITVFDSNGTLVYLPAGSCVIDFIYATDSKKIDYSTEAEINGKKAPLTFMLGRNNKVRIKTSNVRHYPRLEWLPYIRTNLARTKIREFFRQKSRTEKIETGKDLLQKTFNVAGLGFVENIKFKDLRDVLCEKTICSISSLYDLYAAVGEGAILPFDIIKLLYMKKSDSADEKTVKRGVSLLHQPIININKKITLCIEGKDRAGFADDVTHVIRGFGISMTKIVGWVGLFQNKVYVTVDFVLPDLDMLNEIVKRLQLIPGATKVERKFGGQFVWFIAMIAITLVAWTAHPMIIHNIVLSEIKYSNLIIDLFIYGGLLLNFILILYLKHLSEINFPGLRRGKIILGMGTAVILMSTAMLAAEIYYYKIQTDMVFIGIIILLFIIYFLSIYLDYSKVKLPKE